MQGRVDGRVSDKSAGGGRGSDSSAFVLPLRGYQRSDASSGCRCRGGGGQFLESMCLEHPKLQSFGVQYIGKNRWSLEDGQDLSVPVSGHVDEVLKLCIFVLTC